MDRQGALPETNGLLDVLAAQAGTPLAEQPATVLRQIYRQLGEACEEPAELSVRTAMLAGAQCPLRAYYPGEAQPGPVIVYMHGGGWVFGDLDTHDALCRRIAQLSGWRVVAVDYRLAPEHRYPAAHDDCLAAVQFVAAGPAALGAPVTGIAVAGDSAGANLAFHVCAHLGTGVLGQLLLYPLADCTLPPGESLDRFATGYLLDLALLDRFIRDYLQDQALATDPALSPLQQPMPPDLPPTVVLTAGLDPLRDQGRDLAGRIAASGVETHLIEATGLIHGAATLRRSLPTADAIVRRAIATFIDAVTAEQHKRGAALP